MRDLKSKRLEFEKTKKIYDSSILTFRGCEGMDVYNCSVPFYMNGKRYIFGRVEKHNEFARSWVYLFEEIGSDVFSVVPNSMIYQLEDPCVAFINNELVLEGTHIIRKKGMLEYYNAFFYRGSEVNNLYYFSTGPYMMKDIRLVQMDGKIGVFSRPEGKIGFTEINDILELDDELISNAELTDIVGTDGYGGINQCYYLESGCIGTIGHAVYEEENSVGQTERIYVIIASVFNPESKRTEMQKIIGTRSCFPESEYVKIGEDGIPIRDVAFPSGIVMREDGKVDLYSGLSDTMQGRITVDYPFEGYGLPKYCRN